MSCETGGHGRMRNAAARHVCSVCGAGAVTFCVLVVVANLSEYVAAPPEEKKTRRKPLVVAARQRPRPPERRRPRPVGRKHGAGARPVALPVLDLPSSVPAPEPVTTEIDTSDLVRTTLGREAKLAPAAKLVLTEEMVDEPPRVMEKTEPRYPLAARERAIEGKVRVRVLVGRDGEVERVHVVEAEPKGVFERATERAVRRWRFEPGAFRGEPVKVWVSQTVDFSLE